MTPQTGAALLILAVFVLPGFVTLLLRERMFAVRGEDTQFERLLNALYYSALIYTIVFAVGALGGLEKTDVVGFYRGEKSLSEDFVAAVIITLVLPAGMAVIGLCWRNSRKARPFALSFIWHFAVAQR